MAMPSTIERRNRAEKQKQALFYDSAERRRLWIALGVAGALLALVLFLFLASVVGNIVQAQRNSKVQPFAILEHADGTVDAQGPTQPIHPANTLILRRDAEKYISLLFPVTIPTEQEGMKQQVLLRTEGGSRADAWVNAFYKDKARSPLYLYKSGYLAVQHIRCQDDTATHFSCWFDRVPVDGFGTQVGASVAWSAAIRIVQERDPNADEALLFANPNETYVQEITASPIQGGP